MDTIVFNQNINDSNFQIFKKKNKIIVTEIVPFINDLLKITLHITNDKIKNDEIDLPKYDGDKRVFDLFSRNYISAFKEQYKLNSDIYNFRNDFFVEKKINIIEKYKKQRNVLLKNIEIFRRHSEFNINFNFSIKLIIDKELKDFNLSFICNFAKIDKNSKIQLNTEIIKKFNEKYNIEKYNNSVEKYQDFLILQKEIIEKYSNANNIFISECINPENNPNFIY